MDLYRKAIETGQRFAAVILDLTVPGAMGGKTAIRKILEVDPSAIVLVSSGFTLDPIVTDYRRHGFRGTLLKPYGIEELGKALHDALHGD